MINYTELAKALLVNNASSDDVERVVDYLSKRTPNFKERRLYHAIETHPISLDDEGNITNAN